MLAINPYLNFNGNCEEAFTFYQQAFGGEFTEMQRFKDMPGAEQQIAEEDMEKVMHMSLPLGGQNILMGSDVTKDMEYKVGTNVSLSLNPENKEQAEELFNKLSEGGQVTMPFDKQFWNAYFGTFTDKFGIQWQINVDIKEENA